MGEVWPIWGPVPLGEHLSVPYQHHGVYPKGIHVLFHRPEKLLRHGAADARFLGGAAGQGLSYGAYFIWMLLAGIAVLRDTFGILLEHFYKQVYAAHLDGDVHKHLTECHRNPIGIFAVNLDKKLIIYSRPPPL